MAILDPPNIPVIDYAPLEACDAVPHLAAMRSWRRLAAWGFWLALGGLFVYPPLAVAFAAVLAIGSVGALACMVRAAA